MPANLENSAVATGLEKVSFNPIPKKGTAKESSNYRKIAVISHASKIMLKILQAKLQQYGNHQAAPSMGFSRQEYWSGFPCPTPGDFPNTGIEPRSPTLQADSLPTEPQGKPQNTGVGSLSLLQEIFQTQEMNRGLLHFRWTLYQLSYQESPCYTLAK